MTATITTLSDHDVDLFRKLLSLFRDVFAEDEEDEGKLSVPEDGYLATVLADPNFVAVVAHTENDTVMGGLTLRFWRSYSQQGDECYLYDLAVHGAHRRQGVAARLVEHAIALAKARNAVAMWVQAEAGDEDAVGFYRSLQHSELDVSHFELL